MNVTPEMVAPIMAKATRYQGDFRLAMKKVSVVAFLPVNQAMASRIIKYPATIKKTRNGFISCKLMAEGTFTSGSTMRK